jgi:hypothetical protein
MAQPPQGPGAAQGPTAYPSQWRPAWAPPPDSETNYEALALAIDSFLSALSDEEFDSLVVRVRNGGQPQQQPGGQYQQRGQ